MMVDDRGAVVIMRNNQPKYLVMEFAEVKAASQADDGHVTALDDEVMAAAAKYIRSIIVLLRNWLSDAFVAHTGDGHSDEVASIVTLGATDGIGG